MPKAAEDARPAQVGEGASAVVAAGSALPKSWLAIGGGAVAVLAVAGFFLLRPSGENKGTIPSPSPSQSIADPNSDPDFQACLKPSDVQSEACERAVASGKFSGGALSSLYNNRGIGHQKKSELDAAISDFAEAIKLNGRNAFAFNNRGNAYRAQHKDDSALEDFAKAIEIDAKYVSPFNNRGLLYLNKGEYDRAIANFDQVVRLDANYLRAYWNRGSAYLKKGQRDHAIADYNKALSLNPDDTTRKMIEAELNEAKAEPAPQAAATNQTPASAPGPTAQTSTADPKSDAPEASNPPSTSAQATAPQGSDAPNADTNKVDTGKGKEPEPAPSSKVLKSTEEVLADPDFKACRAMGLADCDRGIASGKFEGEALAVLYNNRGQARSLQHDDDRALEDLNKAIALNKSFAAPYANRGVIYQGRKDYDRAIADFDQAIELNSTHFAPFMSRAVAYWDKGDSEHAAADYKRALSLNPPDKVKKDIEQSLKEIEGGAKFPPGSEPAQKQGSADAPPDDKNLALSGPSEGGSDTGSGLPPITKPTEGQGSSLSLLPKEGEGSPPAQEQGSAMKAQLPTSGPWAAIAADGNGGWGSAVGQPSQDEARNAALKDCGGSACKILDALQSRCIAYVESRQGGYWYFDWIGPNESNVQNNALNACNKKAPAGSCKLVKSICAPGSATQASADPKKDADYCMKTIGPDAIPACDRAIASGHFGDRDLATLHNQRGSLHFFNKEDDAAIAEFSEAIRLDGSRANFFGNRGNTYIGKGDYDKAIADLDQAIKLAPESSSGYQGRALAYLKKDLPGPARDDYTKALSLNPDAKDKKDIEKALKDLGPDVRNMKMQ